MKRTALKAEPRTVMGKKLKTLRREGILPGNVYGKDVPSVSLQVNLKEFEAVFKEAGETGLIDLQLDGEARPVLVKNLQLKFPERLPLHIDFYQVNLKEKVKAMVPLEVEGEAKAVTDQIGILLQQISEVEVEALPDKLPENIVVDVTALAAVGDQILVSDLKVDPDITILTDEAQVVVKIDEPVQEEPEEEAPAEEGAEGEEGAAAEGEEAEEKKEGETKEKDSNKEDSAVEEKKEE